MRFLGRSVKVALLGVWAFATPAFSEPHQVMRIGTGGATGVYFPVGGAICYLVNKRAAELSLSCNVTTTLGSVDNTRGLMDERFDFGILQSDVQIAAMAGSHEFEETGTYDNLRSVFSLYAEPLHVMARGDANLQAQTDLAGKKVNIGNQGSGTRVLADALLSTMDIKLDGLNLTDDLTSEEHAQALCRGEVDVAFWAAGLPNASTMEATSSCDVRLVGLAESDLKKILNNHPAYTQAVIPGGLYPGNPEDVTSWGPKAVLMSDVNVSDELVYALVKAVFEQFEQFKSLHPAFATLTPESMVSDALAAPMHPGALLYYREVGLLE